MRRRVNWVKLKAKAIIVITAFVLFAIAAIGALSAHPSGVQDCIDNFAIKGGTNQIVVWGHQMCATAFDQKETAEKRAWALCAIREIPDIRADQAFRVVSDRCYKTNVQ